MVRFVVGRAGSGKTRYCLNKIKELLLYGSYSGKSKAISGESKASSGDGDANKRNRGGLADASRTDHRAIYIVPEQFNLQAEKSIIEYTGVEGFEKASVLSFKRLAHRVFEETGGICRKYINKAGKKICLASVVDELANELEYFSNLKGSDGFVDSLMPLITELKQYNVTAQSLRESLGIAIGGGFVRKVHEISIIYERFCEKVEEGFLDSDDDLTKLAGKIRKSQFVATSKVFINGFSGFTAQEMGAIGELAKYAVDLTICLCCDRLPENRKQLNRLDVFHPVKRTYFEILDALGERGLLFDAVYLGNQRIEEPPQSLQYLERNLYNYRALPFEGEAREITIAACRNYFDEVEYVASDIIRACREKNYRFKDISIICGDLGLYAGLIKPVFSKYGIESFIDRKSDIFNHPLVLLVISALSVLEDDFSYEAMLSYLKTGLTNVDKRDVDVIENFVLAHGITGSMWTNGVRWDYGTPKYEEGGESNSGETDSGEPDSGQSSGGEPGGGESNGNEPGGGEPGGGESNGNEPGGDESGGGESNGNEPGGGEPGSDEPGSDEPGSDESGGNEPDGSEPVGGDSYARYLDRVNEIRGNVLEPLLKLRAQLKKAKSASDYYKALYSFLQYGKAAENTLGLYTMHMKEGGTAKASEVKQVWAAVMDVLNQIHELSASLDISMPMFSKLLRSGLMDCQVGVIPPSSDQVLVGSTDRTMSHSVRLLYVVGAVDGVLPDIFRQDGILSDTERAKLAGFGVTLSKDAKNRAFDELFNVYSILSIPNAELKISYPVSDLSGKQARPTMTVSRLKKLFPKLRLIDLMGMSKKERFVYDTQTEEAAFEGLVAQIRESRDSGGGRLTGEWEAALEYMAGRKATASRFGKVVPSLEYRQNTVALSDYALSLLFGQGGARSAKLSVSRLEQYAQCPFSYFGKHVIKALDRKIYRLELPDVGSFVHRAIEIAAVYIVDGAKCGDGYDWESVSFADCLAKSEIAIREIFAENDKSVFNSSERNKYLTNRMKDTVAWSAYCMVKHLSKGAYIPWRVEAAFDDEKGTELVLDNGWRVGLMGRIDRIDVAPETGYVRVIDFKTGRMELSLQDIYQGVSFQLPVYLDRAVKMLSEPSADYPNGVNGTKPYLQGANEVNEANETYGANGASGANETYGANGEETYLPGGMFYFEVKRPMLDMREKGRHVAATATTATAKEGSATIGLNEELLELMGMNGMFIGDEETFRATVDKDAAKKSSVVKGISFKTDGGFYKRVVAPAKDDFKLMNEHVNNNIKNISGKLMAGDISVNPYKKKGTAPCQWCLYSGACGIELVEPGTAFRKLPKIDDMQVL